MFTEEVNKITGGIVTNNGKNWLLNRAYKEVTDYEEIFYIKAGIGTTTPLVTDTDIEIAIPLENGVVNDDGDNVMTGSSGGDNSTDNTLTFKEGAGVTDATAQNLIKNNSNVTAIWTSSNLALIGTLIDVSKYIALWFYIKDATALAKLKTTGTCLTAKFGTDASNYYSLTKEASDLVVGWNWITSNKTIVSSLPITGTIIGNIDTFIIEVITNNATDTFIAGDIVYDLLRTWSDSDLIRTLVSGFPTFNTTEKSVTSRGYLTSIQANGFPITEIGLFTGDATPLMITHDVTTARSKSSTDEFAFNIKDSVQ